MINDLLVKSITNFYQVSYSKQIFEAAKIKRTEFLKLLYKEKKRRVKQITTCSHDYYYFFNQLSTFIEKHFYDHVLLALYAVKKV